MVKIFKANKFLSFLIVIIIIFLLFRPSLVMNSSLSAVSLWSMKVFPMLFPMFILTRLVVNLSSDNNGFISKCFSKIYNSNSCSCQIFQLSILSGYPMGAKLIQTKLNAGEISEREAYKMLSFCSVSGPGFMIGSVGVAILFSLRAGVIITISNIIAALLNGLLYKEKGIIKNLVQKSNNKSVPLSEIMYDSIKSILMVAGFMILSFLIIDLFDSIGALNLISNAFSKLFNVDQSIISAIMKGTIEITRGASELSKISVNINTKIVILSSLIALGGLSVLFQTKEMFNSKILGYKKLIIQKITQAIFALIVSILLVNLF